MINQTTPGGSPGEPTNNMDSVNAHVINVFAWKLEIEKVDQSHKIISNDNAEFVLYRKATESELADGSVTKTTITGLTGSYVAVQTLTTNEGAVTTDRLPLLNDNEPYYLVETKSPAGYNLLSEPLKVTIDVKGHNTWTKVPISATPETSQTKWNPYVLSNWEQNASLKVTDTSGNDSSSAVLVISAGDHGITYNHINDTTDASVSYMIINNAGVALPNTGGSGTAAFYIIGILLTGLAGTGLLLKRMKRAT